MDIIKEYVSNNLSARIVIRTRTYQHSLAHIQNLVNEAVEDFGELNPEEINIVVYGGERYARTFGVEVNVPIDHPALSKYQQIDKLEFTLA